MNDRDLLTEARAMPAPSAPQRVAPPLPASTPPAARPRRSGWLRLLVVLVILAAAVVALRLTVFAPAPVRVTVAMVTRGAVEETVTNSRAGTVKARRRAQISPEVGGRVVALPYRAGQRVPAGAVVLRLADAVPGAQLQVSQRELAAAEAQARQACLAAEQARRDVERNRTLQAQGIVASDVMDRLVTTAATQAAACDAAHGNAARARAASHLAAVDLDRTVIRAPFDAVVADVTTDVGEFVSPSPPGVPIPPILDLLDPSSLYVSAPMDEVDAGKLHAGLPVRVTLDALPGRQLAGRVTRVAPYVVDREQQNRTVEIEVELADRTVSAALLPGTSADVEVILAVRPDVLRIPTPALIEEKRVLALVGEAGKVGSLVERTVTIGLRNWDFTEIRQGLAAGDRVVLSLDREGVENGAKAVAEARK
jgi:HlyD family secretion protein